MKALFKMFLAFLKIGAFTFGGGYAMIPLIEEEVVNKNKWINKDEFMDILDVSQSFPGALAINCSTFIGYKLGGAIGGLVAILGVTIPSLTIIILIASIFMQFRENYYVNLAFKGITAAVPMLVLVGVVSLAKGVKGNLENILIGLVALVALVVFDIHPLLVIVSAAIYGILFMKKKVK